MNKYLALTAYMKSSTAVSLIILEMYEIILDPKSDKDDIDMAMVTLDDALFPKEDHAKTNNKS